MRYRGGADVGCDGALWDALHRGGDVATEEVAEGFVREWEDGGRGDGMKRGLYRSVWLWLGCFVMAFLLWAWVSSYETGTSYYRIVKVEDKGGRQRWAVYDEGVTVEGGSVRIYLARVSKPGRDANVVREKPVYVRARAQGREVGPAFRWKSYHDADVTLATVQRSYGEVPLWGGTGLYVMLCGGGLLWRRRRWRRLLLEGRAGA